MLLLLTIVITDFVIIVEGVFYGEGCKSSHLMHTFAQTDTNTEAITNIFYKSSKKRIKAVTTEYFWLILGVRSLCLQRLK